MRRVGVEPTHISVLGLKTNSLTTRTPSQCTHHWTSKLKEFTGMGVRLHFFKKTANLWENQPCGRETIPTRRG